MGGLPALTPEEQARFWAKVDKSSDCWVWTGTHSANHYGVFFLWGRRYYAHRVAYELAKGPLKPGRLACHTCDNPPCCNPEHLYEGTPASNIADSILRERRKRPFAGSWGKQVSVRLEPGDIDIIHELCAKARIGPSRLLSRLIASECERLGLTVQDNSRLLGQAAGLLAKQGEEAST